MSDVVSGATLRVRLEASVGSLALDVALEASGALVVVGPNGAGKSTLLSLVLGIATPRRGRVELGGQVVFDADAGIDVPVERRRIAYVPQDYALFPHLDVRQNVEFALGSARPELSRDERQAKATATLRELGLEARATQRPDTLSGGEKQRAALARALCVSPRALLLDEPLAALDVHARREVRQFLADYLRGLSIPTLIVTHDPADAQLLAQSLAVIEQGRVTQTGRWQELVAAPATAFVRELVAAAG